MPLHFAMPDADGSAATPSPEFVRWSLSEFEGCDSIDPGTPADPYIWMFGLEFGRMPAGGAAEKMREAGDGSYSVAQQLTFPYNRNAFKLLAAAHGLNVQDYRVFAHEKRPFVHGSRGFFKGNLYPYACHDVRDWPASVAAEVGLTKDEYRRWCDTSRIPVLHDWFNRHRPKVLVGVGIGAAHLYSRVVFGEVRQLDELHFSSGSGRRKRVLRAADGWRRLLVVPHLSGSPTGLRSDESLQWAGEVLGREITAH